jgi:hypothetical protein
MDPEKTSPTRELQPQMLPPRTLLRIKVGARGVGRRKVGLPVIGTLSLSKIRK